MKTFFAIALNCVYLTLAVGVAKTTHYCMGRENHTAHFSFQVDPCTCSKLFDQPSPCCDDKSILLQIDDDQAASVQLSLAPVQLPFIFKFEYLVVDTPSLTFDETFSHEQFRRLPPDPLYLRFCSLIV